MEPRASTIDVLVTTSSADVNLVDAIARLALEARRHGCELRVRATNPALCRLIEFLGLAEALRLEPAGEPEGGEELGVEEVVDPGDSPS